MRVFLTGGTGLIGSHVAERLRRRGDDVVALVRETSDTGHLAALGCETVVGDLMAPVDELADPIRGADAVVHAAAKVFQGGTRRAFLRVNVEGTENVLRAAALAAPRVVHVSSVAVYAGLPMDRLREDRWTEADPDRQAAYAASKHRAERAAWRLHDEGSVRLTTVRPCVVYGERDRSATPVIVRYADRRIVPLIGGGRTTLPLVYAGNVARGIVAALDREAAVGRAYNLAQDVPITGRALVRLVGNATGRSPRIVAVPTSLARGAAALVSTTTRLVPFAHRVDAPRAVRALSADNPYDSSRARLELGWTGHVAHEEGWRRTMAWWGSR
ncbi:MAG: NAD-dependent epimerase/dehydratase family protein [Longimicrobiales bacterium]